MLKGKYEFFCSNEKGYNTRKKRKNENKKGQVKTLHRIYRQSAARVTSIRKKIMALSKRIGEARKKALKAKTQNQQLNAQMRLNGLLTQKSALENQCLDARRSTEIAYNRYFNLVHQPL